MADTHKAYIEILLDDSGVVREIKEIDNSLDKVGKTAKQSGTQMGEFERAVRSGAAAGSFFGNLLADAAKQAVVGFIETGKETVMVAARVEALRGVAEFLGEQQGYTNEQIHGFEQALRKTGITGKESLDTLIRLMQANIGLENATKLATVAQSAARIAGMNSSETLQQLMYGVVTLQPEMLRTAGIIVNLEQAYSKWAAANNRNVNTLTGAEKQQIALNAVLQEGTRIAGVYGKTNEFVSGRLLSLPRYIENAEEAIGKQFIPALRLGIDALTLLAKTIAEHPQLFTALAGAVALAGAAFTTFLLRAAIGSVLGEAKLAVGLLRGSVVSLSASLEAGALAARGFQIAIGAIVLIALAQQVMRLVDAFDKLLEQNRELELQGKNIAEIFTREIDAANKLRKELGAPLFTYDASGYQAAHRFMLDLLKVRDAAHQATAEAKASVDPYAALRKEWAASAAIAATKLDPALQALVVSGDKAGKTAKQIYDALKQANPELKISEEAVKKTADAHKKAAEAATKHAEALKKLGDQIAGEEARKELADLVESWNRLPASVRATAEAQQAVVAAYDKLRPMLGGKGLPADIEALWIKLKLLPEGMKDFPKALDAAIKFFEERTKSGLDQVNKHVEQGLADQTKTLGAYYKFLDAQEEDSLAKRLEANHASYEDMRQGLDRRSATYRQNLALIDAMEKSSAEKATVEWAKHVIETKKQQNAILALFTGTLSKIPDLVKAAFTGGGGLSGALNATLGDLGSGLGSTLFTGLGNKLGLSLVHGLGDKVASGLLSIIPGIGGALGSLVGPLLGKLFGPTEYQKTMRKANEDLAKLNDQIKETYGSTAKFQEAARILGVDLSKTFSGSPLTRLDETKKAMEQVTKRTEEFNTKLGDTLSQIQKLGGGIPEALRPYIDTLREAGLLTQDNIALLAKIGESATPSYEQLTELQKKYNLTLDQMGPAFQSAHLNAEFQTLIDDLDTLNRGGVDVSRTLTTVGDDGKVALSGVGQKVQELVTQSIKFGHDIPENMKPWIQTLIDSGLLLDESGQKITDISKLKFGESMQTTLEKLNDTLKQFIEALGIKLPDAINKVPKTVDVTVRVHTEGKLPGDEGSTGEVPYHSGGYVQKLHSGGPARVLPFSRVPRFDSGGEVPAILQSGEFVMSRNAVGRIGMRALERLNRGDSGGLMTPAHVHQLRREMAGVREEIAGMRRDEANRAPMERESLRRAIRDALLQAS